MRRAGAGTGALAAVLLLALVVACHADEREKKSRLSECEEFFASIDAEIQGCADGLADQAYGAPPGNDTDAGGCPLLCRNLFQLMPIYCGRLVDAALEPNYTTSLLVRDGQPVNICATFCGSGKQCIIDSALTPRIDLLRWLPDSTSPVWALVALKGGGGKSPPPPPDEDDGGGLNVAAVVAGAVVGSVVLAAAAFFAGRVWQARHRRQQAVAAAPPAGAAGSGSKESMDLESGWEPPQAKLQRSGQDKDLDSATASPCDPSLAPGPQQASADGLQGLADLWAQAVQGAALPPAAQGAPAVVAGEAAGQPHDSAFHSSGQQLSGRAGRLASSAGSAASEAPVPDSPATALPRVASRRSNSGVASAPSAAGDLDRWEVDFSAISLLRLLGEGSCGSVYLATLNETPVAVKVLADTSGTSAAGSWVSSPALQALHRESSVMAALRHPNVVMFLGISYEPPAIISEYCSRGSLFDVLRSASTSEATAASLTWQRRLCMALDAAKGMLALHSHQPPIIHRDLKSPNLLVDGAWRVKVADFNMSKLLEDTGVRSTSLGGMLNPRWLWELLTWGIPWEDRNAFQLVHMVSGGERLAVPAREGVAGAAPDPELYAAYVALIRRCWAQQPEQRPGFAEIIQDLRAMLG
ncbi:hypothetical protein COHA_009983 [Chlorella ohadii]|uniref:Protein kinase domain-containing protein n=1 Tax=Chlorella ohadii TaxID=2649997 RepID=A0AAD5DGR4_9CHLO|nr:hypothetical protein COHA_009983 [Chlorella ohadii]